MVMNISWKSRFGEAELLATRGTIWDGLQDMLWVDCWMALRNSEANLRFSTSTESQIEVTVHDRQTVLQVAPLPTQFPIKSNIISPVQ